MNETAPVCNDATARQSVAERFGLSPSELASVPGRALHDMGTSFGHVFIVATVLVAACIVPALFLPRRPAVKPTEPAVLVGHQAGGSAAPTIG